LLFDFDDDKHLLTICADRAAMSVFESVIFAMSALLAALVRLSTATTFDPALAKLAAFAASDAASAPRITLVTAPTWELA